MHEIEAHAGDARAASVQESGQLDHQPPDGKEQSLRLLDRRRQLELTVITLRRHEQRPRIGQDAARAIDLIEEARAEAARKAIARQRQHVAQGAHADAPQRVHHFIRAVEQTDRQRG